MLEFNVRRQTLSRVDSFLPAERSVGYLIAKINFLTEEWNGKDIQIRAKNKKDKIVYENDVIDGTALIPWEALVNKGFFYVSLFCRDGGTEITTNSVEIPLTETLPRGSDTNPPTPTELDKLWKEVEDLKDSIENIDPDADRFSPTAKVEQTTNGATITITDKDGTTSATITNGKDGKDGIDGKDGADGYTPVKGTDYFTEDDKVEMVNAVLAALPVAEGGSF